MPELPEVERARRLCEEVLVGRSIRRAVVARDEIVVDGTTPACVRRALQGRRVEAAQRYGKHLVLALDERPWLLLHLGMTGHVRVPADTPLTLASSPKGPDTTWPPRFTKLRLFLDDGGELAFTNARRLGRIRLREEPEKEPPLSRLGFDPLTALPPKAELARRLAARRVTLKGLLLDQGFAAGLGNWMADEILYQAGLDPRRKADSLSDAEVGRLRARIKTVTERAVAVDAEKERLPRTWLFHHRWGKEEGRTTARGEKIEFLTLAGRTTAWVPERQA